jgi:hypothetical protein
MVRDDLVHRHVLGDLLAAKPPVVFKRVVLQVFEAPIRRGFAISHTLMLMPSSSAVVIAALSPLLSHRSAAVSSGFDAGFGDTLLAQTAQRLPKPYGGCQRFAGAVRTATSEICVLCEQRSGAGRFDDGFNHHRQTRPSSCHGSRASIHAGENIRLFRPLLIVGRRSVSWRRTPPSS